MAKTIFNAVISMDLVGLALKKTSVLNITVLRTFVTTQQSLQRRHNENYERQGVLTP